MKSQAFHFLKNFANFIQQNPRQFHASGLLTLFSLIFLVFYHFNWSYQIPLLLCLGQISLFISFHFLKENWFQDSKKHYKLIAENLNDIVILHRLKDGKNEYINAAAHAVLGFSQKELTGQSTVFLIHPKDQYKIINQLSGLSESEDFSFVEKVRIRCNNGEFKWMELNVRNLKNGSGKQVFAIFNFRDISEAMELEKANKQFAEELFNKYINHHQNKPQKLIPKMASNS